jgi:hypothetical protein
LVVFTPDNKMLRVQRLRTVNYFLIFSDYF